MNLTVNGVSNLPSPQGEGPGVRLKLLRIMKLTLILLTAAALQVSASGYSQNVTLNLKDVTLDKVFKEIRRQTGYLFLYKNEEVKKIGKVSVNVKDVPVEEAIQESLASTPFHFKMVDKTIVVTAEPQNVTLSAEGMSLSSVFLEIKRQTGYVFWYDKNLIDNHSSVTVEFDRRPLEKALYSILSPLNLDFAIEKKVIVIKSKPVVSAMADTTKPKAPPGEIKGRVVNSKGEPIAGATVTVQGTRKSTITDANGEFSLAGVDDDAVIQITHVQYEIENITLNGKGIVNATLQIKVSSLDELQVIAYGTTTKRLNTGNVSTVKAEEIEKQPVSNPLATLQGRVPGMIITQQTGMPGGSFSVQIRGQNSIASGNDPLYVIDGVPYPSQLLPNLGGVPWGTSANGSSGSPLSYINPSDIESIDVLKDADATAIYGSRGANGVVLITTKKGKIGKANVTVNMYTGFGKVSRKTDLLNTRQYLDMRYEALSNDGVDINSPSSWSPDLTDWDTSAYTNWQKTMIGGTSHYYDAQISVSGGTTIVQYLLGGGYHKETDIFPGNYSDQKTSVHFNITTNSSNQKFKAMLSGNYIVDNNKIGYYDLTNQSFLPPNAPDIYNPDGSLNWANDTWSNPLALLISKYNPTTNNLVSNALLSYKILPTLEFKTSLGYNNMQVNEIRTFPISFFPPSYNITTGSSDFTRNNISSWIIEPQVNYQLIIGKGKLTTLLGGTIQKIHTVGEILNANGFTNDAFLENIRAASKIVVQSTTNTQYKYNGAFSRLNYNWQDKYLINITGRRDGSSRFGPGKQFANFGAIGVGWVFSQENFIHKSFPFLSFGKLRASYGSAGNDLIGDYQYITTYSSTAFPYQGVQGLYPNNLFNPDYSWEVNKKLELAIEGGLFKDRIYFAASYYRNRSSNQLVGYPVSRITGFGSVVSNLPALVQNKGFEFLINTTNIKSKSITWTSSVNLTIFSNKLVEFSNLSNTGYARYLIIDQPLNIIKVYHLLGVNDTTGVYQFVDSKGTPTYNPSYPDDATVLINTNPKFYGGFQNNFQFKGFELSVFFQFVKQIGRNYLFSNSYAPGFYFAQNQSAIVLNRWQKPGDLASIQQYTQSFGSPASIAYEYAQNSDYAFSDASFIRLKNVSFSYRLSDTWAKKWHLQNFRIYFQGQNLLTITNYKGMDPENQSTQSLPPLRVFTFGIQITL